MTLLTPIAAWLFVIAGGVVALYLLKIRRRRAVVPALDFWRDIAGMTRARSLFDQLKRWLSLLLWLIIVTALVLAIANPVLSFGRIKPRAIAVIIDNGASMRTMEADGRTRFAAALDTVHEVTRRRPVRDEWLLIDARYEPRVVAGWTRRTRDITDALVTFESFPGESDVTTALDLAADLLRGKERPSVLLLSDFAGDDLATEPDAAAIDRFDWPLGARDDNLGITHVYARRHRGDLAHHVLVRVLNSGAIEVETSISFALDDSVVDVLPITVPAGGVWEDTVVFDEPAGGMLRIELGAESDDTIGDDDVAYAVLEPIEPATVWLVTPDTQRFFFEQALLAMSPLVATDASRVMTAAQFDALGALSGDDLPDLIVVNNTPIARMPERGRFMFINIWPDEIGAASIGTLDGPRMIASDRAHPVMQHLNLQPVTLARAHQIDLLDNATVLAASSEGDPLITLHEARDRTALVLGFGILESDMPFRTAFPILLRNMVRYVLEDAAELLPRHQRLGEPIVPLRALPPGVESIAVARSGSEDEPIEFAVDQGRITIPAAQSPGAMRVEIDGTDHYTSINLASAKESDVAPLLTGDADRPMLELSGALLGTTPWFALAVAVLALVTLEWVTYHMRWTE